MLSNENPPPDPSFPCEISQLKSITSSSNGGDERAFADKLDVDLLKSNLDDNHPLPKFSIRDYVLEERVKDIKNSWPFSQQNLNLCLKHGVQDVLPPFQSLVSLRNTLKKVQSNIAGPVNKSRFTLKLKSIAEPEPMASQVCPVCRNFSSSSNTTLNAHIDQCLSEDPANKPQTNSEVVKHKMKGRKMRLMVDIYKTAICCTLEDLDQRNGTNWASNTSLPAQDFNTVAQERNKKCSSVQTEGINDDGGVYIDSNGMKLRILSKLNANDGLDPRKLADGYNGNKPLTNKKRKYLLRERKFLVPCHGRGGGSSSLIANQHTELEITGQQKDSMDDGYKEDPSELLKHDDSIKSGKLGSVKQWEGSKQTGQKKKITRETESMYTKRKASNLKAKKVLSSLVDIVKRNRASKSAFSPGEKQCIPSESQIPSPSLRTTSSEIAVFSGKKKSSPLLKKLSSSVMHDSVRELKQNLGRKRLQMKKHLVNYSSEPDEEIFGSRSVIYYRKYNMPETLDENARLPEKSSSDRPSVTRSKVLKLRKKTYKPNMCSNASEISHESHRSSSGNNTANDDVTVEVSNILEEADRLDESTRKPTCETVHGEACAAYSKSLDFAFSEGEMLLTDKLGQDVFGEMDSQQHSYVDVDPIPIPGPPGSFLPSPGRVGSEELQGNSSLTTTRIHSSEDELEVVHMNSSDSPVSATSSLSNTKDAASRNASLHHRDSQFMEQSTAMGYEPNAEGYIFSPISSLEGRRALVSRNFEAQHRHVGDSGSPSPSASNPVLRLMGKNLMVVNKDDNISPAVRMDSSSLSTDINRNEILSSSPISSQYFRVHSTNGFKESANFCQPVMFSPHLTTWKTYDNEKLSSPTPTPCHCRTSLNAFYGYPTRDYPLSTVSPDQMDPNMSRWNMTAEGSWINCPNPQTSAPSPRCLLHFSPGFP